MGLPRVFPVAPSRAGEPVVETVAYATTVLQAYGGSEQRLMRRANPTLGLRFGYTPPTGAGARQSRHLFNLAPEDGLLVPWWPAIATLNANAASGATALAADLAGLPVVEQDGPVDWILWRSQFEWERLAVSDVSEAGLTLAAPLEAAWGAGTSLLPLVHAFLEQMPTWERIGPEFTSGVVGFRAGLVTGYRLPAGAEMYAPDAYLGLDVLTSTPGDADSTETLSRRVAVVAADAGREVWDSQDATGALEREVLYRLIDRAAQAALRRFFAARAGALRPFWVPTWDADLATVGATGAGANLLVVEDGGYLEALAAAGVSREHLAIRLPSGAWDYLQVGEAEAAVGDLATLELWTPGPSEALPSGHRVSVLRHCRLGSDALELTHFDREYAEARLTFRELAVDCPTGATL